MKIVRSKKKAEKWNHEIPAACKGCIHSRINMRELCITPQPIEDNTLIGVDPGQMEEIESVGITRLGKTATRLITTEVVIKPIDETNNISGMLVTVEQFQIDCLRQI